MAGLYIVRKNERGSHMRSLLIPPIGGTGSPFLIVPGYELLDPRELEDLLEAYAEKRSRREREQRTWRLPER